MQTNHPERPVAPLLASLSEFLSAAQMVSNVLPESILDLLAGTPQAEAALKQFDYLGEELERTLGSTARAMNSIRRRIDATEPVVKRAIELMTEQGWCADINMPISLIKDIEPLYTKEGACAIDKLLAEYFSERVEDLFARAIALFPKRNAVLESARVAYTIGEYPVCIPALLAQLDGLIEEQFGISLYRSENRQPALARKLQLGSEKQFHAILLKPIIEVSPLNASSNVRPTMRPTINRHAILHGEWYDYGTKDNALRTIALVGLVTHLIAASKGS